MKGRLADKVALITGGGSGLGKAAAIACAKEGAKVVVGHVSEGSGEKTVAIIKENGGEAISIRADVSKSSEVQAMVQKAVDTYGRLDCAYNNAGVARLPS